MILCLSHRELSLFSYSQLFYWSYNSDKAVWWRVCCPFLLLSNTVWPSKFAEAADGHRQHLQALWGGSLYTCSSGHFLLWHSLWRTDTKNCMEVLLSCSFWMRLLTLWSISRDVSVQLMHFSNCSVSAWTTGGLICSEIWTCVLSSLSSANCEWNRYSHFTILFSIHTNTFRDRVDHNLVLRIMGLKLLMLKKKLSLSPITWTSVLFWRGSSKLPHMSLPAQDLCYSERLTKSVKAPLWKSNSEVPD